MSLLAEENVISCLLNNPRCVKDVTEHLKADMFSDEILGKIYLEYQRGYDNGDNVTLVTLEQKLRNENVPASVIMERLKWIALNTVVSNEIFSASKVVIDDYKTNQLKSIINKPVSSDGIEQQLSDMIAEIELLQGNRKSKTKSLKELVTENYKNYFKDKEHKSLYTGFLNIDCMLGGLEGGDMIVIGARPSVGKSALTTQIATYMSNSFHKVGFYSLEMQEKQMYERFIASASGFSMSKIRGATYFENDEATRWLRANETLMDNKNLYITTGARTMSEIRNEVKNMGYDVLIIDYLQLIKNDTNYRGNRYAEVGAISREIKELAMDLNIPIIALSQLNRCSEAREIKEPSLSDLRESGDIEQDASVIMFLWNMNDGDKSDKCLTIAKNRQGQTGRVRLEFNGATMRFKESNKKIDMEELRSGGNKWKKAKDDDKCPF